MVQLGELIVILDLHRQGLSISAIARRTGRDPKTVSKYIERGLEPPAYSPHNGARAFIDTNVVGTFNLLEASRRHWAGLNADAKSRFRFLHVSTDELYGSLGPQGAFTESSRYDPSSPYSATKAAADHLVMSWHRTYGLPVVIASCSNNYGPYQFPEKLIPLTLLNALKGKPVPLDGDGANVRDWLYVMDHVRALQLILKDGRVGQIYNIGGRSERSNLQTVTAICKILDQLVPSSEPYDRLITFARDRPCHDQRTRSIPARSRRIWAGGCKKHSNQASPRRCAGISITIGGGGPCASVFMAATGWG